MTWSFTGVGNPEFVAQSFEAYGETIHGNDRFEYEDAKAAVLALIGQNLDRRDDVQLPVISLECWGSGVGFPMPQGVMGGKPRALARSCEIVLKRLSNEVVPLSPATAIPKEERKP